MLNNMAKLMLNHIEIERAREQLRENMMMHEIYTFPLHNLIFSFYKVVGLFS